MATYKNPTTGVIIKQESRDPQDLANQGFLAITPETLRPEKAIDITPQEPDATNYQGIISGGLENANAILKMANQPPIGGEITAPTSLDAAMAKLLQGETPPSGASLYENVYGVGPTQEEISIKQETERKAREELDILNAQMRALSAEAKAAPIQLQQEATGRGITAGGLAPLQTARLRDIALRSLPLEGQILAQQAVLTGSQRALQLAQSKFDKVFELRMADQDRFYNYQKEQRAMIYDRLNKKEQQQIDAMNKADDIKREDYKINNSLAQSWAEKAVNNGQSDIAAKISALDPKSPSFQADLAKLQGQIKLPQKLTTKNITVGSGKTAKEYLITYNEMGKEVKRELLSAGGGGGGTSATTKAKDYFTKTQISEGASKANLTISQFGDLTVDEANKYVSGGGYDENYISTRAAQYIDKTTGEIDWTAVDELQNVDKNLWQQVSNALNLYLVETKKQVAAAPTPELSEIEKTIQRKQSEGVDKNQIKFDLEQAGFSKRDIINSSVGGTIEKVGSAVSGFFSNLFGF